MRNKLKKPEEGSPVRVAAFAIMIALFTKTAHHDYRLLYILAVFLNLAA